MTPPAAQNSEGAVRLYRYMQARWALRTLETGELRVSRLASLNDPFEFRPALPFVNPVYSHDFVDQYLGFLMQDFDPCLGIICFSEEISDPVLWSHYADSHRGIAIGFNLIKNDQLWPMDYPEERPVFDTKRFPTMTQAEMMEMVRRILAAKAPSWKYEREQRVFVDLGTSRTDGTSHFHRIPPNCLSEVILGIDCNVTEGEIRAALVKGGNPEAKVTRARRCLTRFKILV